MLTASSESLSQLAINNLSFVTQSNLYTGAIKSGFNNIDNTLGGLSRGEFIIIGGIKNVGKTTFLIHLALNVSLINPVLFISYSVPNGDLANLFISNLAPISIEHITDKNVSFYDELVLNEVRSTIKNYKVFIGNNCNELSTSFNDYCKQQIEQNGIQLIIVDGLQTMRNYCPTAINELKKIAKENNICVIAASGYEQAFYGKLELSNFQIDDSIIATADKVIVVNRPECFGITHNEKAESWKSITEIVMIKNNQGALATFKFGFVPNYTKFIEIK